MRLPQEVKLLSKTQATCTGGGEFSFSLKLGITPDPRGPLMPENKWLLIQPAIVVRSAVHARHFEQLHGPPPNKIAYGDADGVLVVYYLFVRPGFLGNDVPSSRYHSIETAIDASRAYVTDFQSLCERELRYIISPADLLEWGDQYQLFKLPAGMILKMFLDRLVLGRQEFVDRYRTEPVPQLYREFYLRAIDDYDLQR